LIKITQHTNLAELETKILKSAVIEFLYTHLDRFRDTVSAISKALDYAFSSESGKGGFVLLAWMETQLAGVLVMNKTGMQEFIPPYILVYIAVNSDFRGQGIGSALIKETFQICGNDIALHVEYDNPAKKLYERLGFTSKYAKMRWHKG